MGISIWMTLRVRVRLQTEVEKGWMSHPRDHIYTNSIASRTHSLPPNLFMYHDLRPVDSPKIRKAIRVLSIVIAPNTATYQYGNFPDPLRQVSEGHISFLGVTEDTPQFWVRCGRFVEFADLVCERKTGRG